MNLNIALCAVTYMKTTEIKSLFSFHTKDILDSTDSAEFLSFQQVGHPLFHISHLSVIYMQYLAMLGCTVLHY